MAEDFKDLVPAPIPPFKYCSCSDGKSEIVFESREAAGCDCYKDTFFARDAFSAIPHQCEPAIWSSMEGSYDRNLALGIFLECLLPSPFCIDN